MKIDGLTKRHVSASNDALKYRTCTWRLSSARIYSEAKIKAVLANPQGFRRNVTHSTLSLVPRAVKPTEKSNKVRFKVNSYKDSLDPSSKGID